MSLKQFGSQHWLPITGFTTAVLLIWWIGRPPALPDEAASTDAPAAGSPATGSFEDIAGLVRPEAGQLQPPAAASIAGRWVGHVEVGNTRTEFRFNLQENNGSLSGTVRFPVGDGIVQAGSLLNGNVTLLTVNDVPATGRRLQTQFTGTHAGDHLYLVMKTENGDVNLTLQRAP